MFFCSSEPEQDAFHINHFLMVDYLRIELNCFSVCRTDDHPLQSHSPKWRMMGCTLPVCLRHPRHRIITLTHYASTCFTCSLLYPAHPSAAVISPSVFDLRGGCAAHTPPEFIEINIKIKTLIPISQLRRD